MLSQAHEFRSIPRNNFYRQRMFRLKEKLPVTDASRTFGRPFAKEKEEGMDLIPSTDSGKSTSGTEEKSRAKTALSKGDTKLEGEGEREKGREREREREEVKLLIEESRRGNRSQSFDSSPSSHDKSRKLISFERKRAASLNSHSPSDVSRPINFLIPPEGRDCSDIPTHFQTQRDVITDSSVNNPATGNNGMSSAEFFMRADRYGQTSLDSTSWSPNISSRTGSIDQESGKESHKSVESGVQDQDLGVSAAAGFTSEDRERERGARSISIGSYSRSPTTRSPSPPSVVSRAGKSISNSPKINTPPFPLPLSVLQSTDAASFNFSTPLFLSPNKLKIPRSPRRSAALTFVSYPVSFFLLII